MACVPAGCPGAGCPGFHSALNEPSPSSLSSDQRADVSSWSPNCVSAQTVDEEVDSFFHRLSLRLSVQPLDASPHSLVLWTDLLYNLQWLSLVAEAVNLPFFSGAQSYLLSVFVASLILNSTFRGNHSETETVPAPRRSPGLVCDRQSWWSRFSRNSL